MQRGHSEAARINMLSLKVAGCRFHVFSPLPAKPKYSKLQIM